MRVGQARRPGEVAQEGGREQREGAKRTRARAQALQRLAEPSREGGLPTQDRIGADAPE